jgi:DNA-binding Lrp family transcriptional regulator
VRAVACDCPRELPRQDQHYSVGAGDPDALVRARARDLDHLKRVVDRIRRTGKVTGTKTLIVLGAARRG